MTATVYSVGEPQADEGPLTVPYGEHDSGDLAVLFVGSGDTAVRLSSANGFVQRAAGYQAGGSSTVAHVASVAAAEANPATTFTMTIPAGTLTDHDIYVFVMSRGHSSSNPFVTCEDTDTAGNDYTRLFSSTNRRFNVFRKKATSATASKVVTVAGCIDSCAGGLSVYSGGAAGDPTTNLVYQSHVAGVESHSAFTPTVAGSMVTLTVFNFNATAVTSQAATSPSALTQRFEKQSTGGRDCSVNHASALQSGRVTTGTLRWSQSNFDTVSVAFAIKPVVTTLSSRLMAVFTARVTSDHMVPPVVAASLTHQFAVIYVVRGGKLTGNPLGHSFANNRPASTAVSIEPGNASAADQLILFALARSLESIQATGWGNAGVSGITEHLDINTNAGDGAGLTVVSAIRAVTGLMGPFTATLDVASLQAWAGVAILPGITSPTLGTFLAIVDPDNPLIQVLLNVPNESGFREEEPVTQGERGRSFDGTWLSTERDPKRVFTVTAEFPTPTAVEVFEALVRDREMYMVSGPQGALRGGAAVLVRVIVGRKVPTEYATGEVWAVDLTMEQV